MNEYEEGFQSFDKNIGALLNPYPMGTAQYNDFERGWLQAQRLAPDGTIEEYARLRRRKVEDANAEARRKVDETKNAYLLRKG